MAYVIGFDFNYATLPLNFDLAITFNQIIRFRLLIYCSHRVDA
jgi:hypothetical protein